MNKTFDLLREVSIKKGREEALREVLDIIDYYEEQCTKYEGVWLEAVRKDVLALKGGEQK